MNKQEAARQEQSAAAAQVEKATKEPTVKQQQYREYMRAHMQSNNCPEAFAQAIANYRQHVLKKLAASDVGTQASSGVEVTPQKKRAKAASLTPDKEAAPQSESASSSTGK